MKIHLVVVCTDNYHILAIFSSIVSSSETSKNFSMNSLTYLLNLISDLHRFQDMT